MLKPFKRKQMGSQSSKMKLNQAIVRKKTDQVLGDWYCFPAYHAPLGPLIQFTKEKMMNWAKKDLVLGGLLKKNTYGIIFLRDETLLLVVALISIVVWLPSTTIWLAGCQYSIFTIFVRNAQRHGIPSFQDLHRSCSFRDLTYIVCRSDFSMYLLGCPWSSW